MAKSLQRSLGFVLDDFARESISKVFVIGCGGNGSHLVPDLARFLSTLEQQVSLVLVDGDTVEEKNLIRQHFIKNDIGRNKAEVLAARYGAAFGVDIGSVSEYLTKENSRRIFNHMRHPAVIFTCTDNLKSRKIVSGMKGDVWIDLGNEESGGQVTFSYLTKTPSRHQEIKDKSNFPVPHVFELFPDYDKRVLKEQDITQQSCAEMAAESPVQAGFVNATCAMLAKNWVHALFTGNPIRTHQVFFSTDNTFEHRSITKETIEGWIERYPRFSKHTI